MQVSDLPRIIEQAQENEEVDQNTEDRRRHLENHYNFSAKIETKSTFWSSHQSSIAAIPLQVI